MNARASEELPTNKRLALGARSRDEILNAALRTMALYGYDGTSISRIARESGLPSSSIYWHFASKSGVLDAVMVRGADRFFTPPPATSEHEALAPRERFRRRLAAAGRSAEANPEFLRLLFLLVLSGGLDENLARHARDVTERGKRQLREEIREAFIEEGDEAASRVADHLVDFAQGAFDGIFLAPQIHPGVLHSQLVEQLGDSILVIGDAFLASAR